MDTSLSVSQEMSFSGPPIAAANPRLASTANATGLRANPTAAAAAHEGAMPNTPTATEMDVGPVAASTQNPQPEQGTFAGVPVTSIQSKLQPPATFQPENLSRDEIAEILGRTGHQLEALHHARNLMLNSSEPLMVQKRTEIEQEMGELSIYMANIIRVSGFANQPAPPAKLEAVKQSAKPQSAQPTRVEQAYVKTGDKRRAVNINVVENDGFQLVQRRRHNRNVNVTNSPTPVNTNNRYQQLESESRDEPQPSTSADSSGAPQQPTVKQPKKPPPFFWKPNKNWQHIMQAAKSICPSLKFNTVKDQMRITVATNEEHKRLKFHLCSANIPIRTFLLDEEKPYKFVVRGLPVVTPQEEVQKSIEELGFIEVRVTQMHKGNKLNRSPLPLFYIQMSKKNDQSKMYGVEELMGALVRIEKYRGTKGPSQCHNCQGFFHSAAACYLPPKCVKCAEGHRTVDCPHTELADCKCCNCGQLGHPANYRLCPRFPGARQAGPVYVKSFTSNTVKPNVSFANMTSGRREENSAPVPSASNSPSNTPILQAPSASKNSTSTSNASRDANPSSSGSDFFSNVLKLEATYAPQLILQAYKKALPAIRSAVSDYDRFYYLYESLLELSV